jgi:Cu(I)/Ag(I) efflux system protein CusF
VKPTRILMSALFGALTAVAGLAVAQSASGHGHGNHGMASAAMTATTATAEMSQGEVRKLDVEQQKVTLKHGPLKSLDMPAMTMVFQATDQARSMLGKLTVGDKVRFTATNPGGKLTVTEIQPEQ